MTRFDAYIKKLFEEDLGNMGPKVAGISTSTSVGSTAMPSGASKSSNPTGTPSSAVGANTNDSVIKDLMDDPTLKWQKWLTGENPNVKAAVDSRLQTIFDPNADPNERDNTLNSVNKNPDLQSYVTNNIAGGQR